MHITIWSESMLDAYMPLLVLLVCLLSVWPIVVVRNSAAVTLFCYRFVWRLIYAMIFSFTHCHSISVGYYCYMAAHQANATKHRQETLDARHLFIIIDTLQFIFNYTCIAIISIHFDTSHAVSVHRKIKWFADECAAAPLHCCRCGCYCWCFFDLNPFSRWNGMRWDGMGWNTNIKVLNICRIGFLRSYQSHPLKNWINS